MKEYNRETKRWEEPKPKEGSLKKRKLCIGGKEHDYQICLPKYMDEHQNLPLETIQAYYDSQDRMYAFAKKEQELLIALGIKTRYINSFGRIYRYFKCSKCGKQEYDLKDM